MKNSIDKTVSGWEWRMACFWEIGGGNLHRNYTDWEEFQYDKNKE